MVVWIAACALLPLAALPAQTQGSIRVRALIDGRSRLVIRGSTVYWQHFDYAAPGLHLTAKRQTDIWTKFGKSPEQYYRWCPIWANGCDTCSGTCGEMRGRHDSLPFQSLMPSLPGVGISISKLDLIACRKQCTLVEIPSAANGYTAVLEFDDNGVGGSAIYEVRIDYSINAPASYAAFGQGCGGAAGTPRLRPASGQLPWLCQSMDVEIDQLPSSGPVTLMLGLSRTSFGSTTLPLDLTALGMPGCQLLVAPDFVFGLVRVGGTATFSVKLPEDPRLLGVEFFQQAMVADPGANKIGVTLSNAGAGKIGAK